MKIWLCLAASLLGGYSTLPQPENAASPPPGSQEKYFLKRQRSAHQRPLIRGNILKLRVR